jgi:hypothetical protein
VITIERTSEVREECGRETLGRTEGGTVSFLFVKCYHVLFEQVKGGGTRYTTDIIVNCLERV